MKMLSEELKIDVGLTSSNLNGAGTGQYFSMADYNKALFCVEIGAMAAAATSVLQVMQATNAAAGGAKVVTNNAATITANTNVAQATLTAAACAPPDTCVINGLTFTGGAAANLPNRVFLADAGDNNATAASLAAAINHATAGVPGVLAAANAAVVTLTAIEPGERAITVVGTAVRLVAATVRAIGYVECDAAFLDTANDFNHLAIRVTNSAAMQTGAVLIRGKGRYSPTQYVAAAKADVAP
jgi:hypothetical protein